MMDQLLVSVIIPCYNVQDFIEECIASVVSQTYPNLEVICVDNSSTDKTYDILLNLKNKYSELLVAIETKKGASAARNKGLSIAKGEWIQFLDADDLLYPTKIEHQLTKVTEKNYSDVVFVAGAHIARSLNGIECVSYPKCTDIWCALSQVRLGNTCSNLFNKRLLDLIGGWNEELRSSQEYDLMFRLLKRNSSVVFDMEPLTIIRQREGSITTTNKVANLKRRIDHLASIFDHVNSLPNNTDDVRNVAQALFEVIKELYRYDSKLSLNYLDTTLGRGYTPSISEAITPTYLRYHNLLGYNIANKILKVMKGSLKSDA